MTLGAERTSKASAITRAERAGALRQAQGVVSLSNHEAARERACRGVRRGEAPRNKNAEYRT